MSDAVIVALISLVGTIITVFSSAHKERKKLTESFDSKMDAKINELKANSDKKDDEIKNEVHELKNQITAVDSKLDKHISTEELIDIKQRRVRILRTSDDILNKKEVSSEMCEDVQEDIDVYRDFCKRHPEYHNHKGINAMKNIETYYEVKYAYKGE